FRGKRTTRWLPPPFQTDGCKGRVSWSDQFGTSANFRPQAECPSGRCAAESARSEVRGSQVSWSDQVGTARLRTFVHRPNAQAVVVRPSRQGARSEAARSLGQTRSARRPAPRDMPFV